MNPVLFSWGSFSVRWYGLCCMIGYWVSCYLFIFYLNQSKDYQELSSEKQAVLQEDFSTSILIAVIVGSRLGNFLLYQWPEKLSFYEFIAFWKGGLSFHGGIFAAVFYAIYFAYRRSFPILLILDGMSFAAPFSLMMGRIGNFINQELVGLPTDQSWGVYFPLYDNFFPILRHPSQLYESFLEGPVTFFLTYFCAKKTKFGSVTGFTWFFYSIARIFCENYRELFDEPIALGVFVLSLGQIYSVVLFFVSLAILITVHVFGPNDNKALS